MTARIMLEPRLDTSAAAKLQVQIEGAKDNDLILDAAYVEMLGGLCLETMLMAKHRWQESRHSFRIENGSDAFTKDLVVLGVRIEDLCAEVMPS